MAPRPVEPGGEHDGPDVALRALGLHGVEVEPAVGVGRDGGARDAEQLAHARVGVVRGGAVDDALAGMDLARHPQRLEVGDRPARGQVAEAGGGQAEHDAQLVDHLDLEPARPRPAVERVVVGVDEHRRQVAGHRHRVRRLEHLPGVARVEEGVVVGHPLAEGVPRGRQPLRVGLARGVRVVGAEPRLPRLDEGGGLRDEVGELGGAGGGGAGGRRHGGMLARRVCRSRLRRCAARHRGE